MYRDIKTALATIVPAAALLALAACVTTGEDARSPNPSTHDAAFFEELLTGRAYVYAKPYAKNSITDERDRAAGIFFGAGGKAFICTRIQGSTRQSVRNWKLLPSEKHRAVLAMNEYRHVPFYDGESGQLKLEWWSDYWREWKLSADGWVQESWPRVLAESCKKFERPADVAVNEKQTDRDLGPMRKQDPDAPIRRGG